MKFPKSPSADRNSIHYARLRIEHAWFFFFVIVPVYALFFGKPANNLSESEKSWQNVSLFTSQLSLLILGSRWYVRKRRLGLKSIFALITYFAFVLLFLSWDFKDNRTGIVAYVMLSAISFYGAAFWAWWIASRGDWGTWQLGESKKYIQRLYNRENGRSRAAEPPSDARPSDSAPLPFRFMLPDSRTIRGESWQGTVVAEFSSHDATVHWPTESKWRRIAPSWAVPCWQPTLDQLQIWCEAEDAKLQIDDSARIEFS